MDNNPNENPGMNPTNIEPTPNTGMNPTNMGTTPNTGMNPNNMGTTPNTEMNPNTFEPKTKKSNIKTIIISLIALIIVVAGIFCLYKFILYTPKNVFLNNINKEYESLSKSADNNAFKGKNIAIDSSFSMNFIAGSSLDEETQNLIDILNKIGTINFSSNISADNKDIDLNLNFKNSTGSLNLESYIRDSSVYIFSKELFNGYIKAGKLNISSSSNISFEEAKYVLEKSKDVLLSSLDNSKFVSTTSKLNIDDKMVDSTKISYVIDNEELNRIIKVVASELAKDTKSVEIFAEVTGNDKETIISSLKTIASSKENIADLQEDSLELYIYTKGLLYDGIGYGIALKGETPISLNYINYDNKTIVNLKSSSITLINSITKKIDNKITTVITALTAQLNIDTVINGESSTSTFKLTEASSGLASNGTVTISSKNSNNVYDDEIKIEANLKQEEQELLKVNSKITTTLKEGTQLKNVNVNSAKDVNDLTEEDTNSILTKLMENKYIEPFAILLMGSLEG